MRGKVFSTLPPVQIERAGATVTPGRSSTRGPSSTLPALQSARAALPSYLPPALAAPRRLLLLPALNEEQGLNVTLGRFGAVPFPGPGSRPAVAVVDGWSTDRTASVAERYGAHLLRQEGRGKGGAVREGLAWAKANGLSTVAVMDADSTYPAESLPELFDLLDAGHDVVIGVRRPSESPFGSARTLVHRIGNGLLNYAAAQVSGQPVLDICSGFWGVRTEALERLALVSDGFEIESELFLKAFRAGLRVAQIPITYTRRAGEAKLHAARDGARILLSIARHSLRRAPMSSPGRDALGVGDDLARLHPLLLALAPKHVVVLSARSRLDEAERIARRITSAMPTTQVATAALPPGVPADIDRALSEGSLASRSATGPRVVVTLPARETARAGVPRVFVGIPRTQRLFEIPIGPRKDVPGGADPPTRPSGFRVERMPKGRRGAWMILAAAFEPRGTFRELASVHANAGVTSVRCYRRWWHRGSTSAGRGPDLPITLARALSPHQR